MDVNSVKDFWQTRATAGVGDNEVTHSDIWQRWLEIETVRRFLRQTDRVIDIGCGNGFTTRSIANLVREVVGIDYSEEMIGRANAAQAADPLANRQKAMTFQVCDVTALTPANFGTFDVAISERCLINLADWNAQKRAIANIASVVKPGGRFLFIEGSYDGRAQLNNLRESVGLESMPTVWHNIDFKHDDLFDYLDQFFAVDQRLHFGVYDFIARVVHPLMVAPNPPQYDAPINKVAAELAAKMQQFGEISRVLFLVLKRK